MQTGLTLVARGPRASRAVRHTLLRKVVVEHGEDCYLGSIRNISATGAMVEGLWNVPPGTVFTIVLDKGHRITATCRWCEDDRTGMEFAVPLPVDSLGRVAMIRGGEATRTPFAQVPVEPAPG